MAGNKQYVHITTAAATTAVTTNSGAILGSVYINTSAASSVLTIFDAATTAQCTAANTVAIIATSNANVPGFTYDCVMSRGIFYTLASGNPDVTITYQ
jgi:hypothetical protein